MRKQYAVFGLGSFGESVAVALQELGCEVVVVDNHMERIEIFLRMCHMQFKRTLKTLR